MQVPYRRTVTSPQPATREDRLAAVEHDTLPRLVIAADLQASGPHPYDVYLSQCQGETLRTMRGCLDRMARLLAGVRLDEPTPEEVESGAPVITGAWVPWWELRYPDTTALRAVMVAPRPDGSLWSISHVNKHLSALRRVLKECWRLKLMSAEDYHRAIDIEAVKGSRVPAGRDVAQQELDALLTTCDQDPLGIRDAAMIAVLYATGVRRNEAATLDLGNYSVRNKTLRIIGKGDKERLVPVSIAALPYLEAWLRIRGSKPGALFCPVLKGGKIVIRRLHPQTVADILDRRERMAGLVLPVNPHDLRRTLTGDLLDNGTDLATVQEILGHASADTTARYDRRGLDVKRDALDGLRLRRPEPRHDID
jgi:site-specific recombinase XerD